MVYMYGTHIRYMYGTTCTQAAFQLIRSGSSRRVKDISGKGILFFGDSFSGEEVFPYFDELEQMQVTSLLHRQVGRQVGRQIGEIIDDHSCQEKKLLGVQNLKSVFVTPLHVLGNIKKKIPLIYYSNISLLSALGIEPMIALIVSQLCTIHSPK